MSLRATVAIVSNKLEAKQASFTYQTSFDISNNYAASFDVQIVGSPHIRYGNLDPKELIVVKRLSDEKILHCPYESLSNFHYVEDHSGDPTATESFVRDAIAAEAIRSDANIDERMDGLSLKKVTQAEYDAIATKDPDILYIVV